ncbi:MAG TPA: M48 family metalloprotease [Terriglobia bacterium]|nr:M48 family metalloprotease [Terriglobia bacterium]
MNRVQFEEKVRSFEALAWRRPAAYRVGAALFAFAGYAAVFLLLAVVVSVMGLAAAILLLLKTASAAFTKVILALGIMSLAIIRALWVRVPPPVGERLEAKQVPELFTTIEEIRQSGHGPRIHAVLLTRDYNAAVVQHAELGVLGWRRNYLLIGAPLMMGLDPEQFRAVLAHEIGHLSGAHSALSAWVYRLRVTWNHILGVLQGRRASKWISRLLHWYLERFNAYTFVLSRLQEVEADRFAARLAGSRALADALVAIAVHARFLDKVYWARIQDSIRSEPSPPASPFSSMREAFDGASEEANRQGWLERALLRQTSYSDTHPALQDRLGLLQEAARLPDRPAISAADRYLGPLLESQLFAWDRHWSLDVTALWAERRRELLKQSERREALREAAAGRALSGDEEWEMASLTEALEGPEAAVPLIRAILRRNPTHVTALFNLGRILLDQDEEEGVECLEKAMQRDKKAILPACGWIARFWEERGVPEKARPYWGRSDERGELVERNAEEQRQLSSSDTFLSHGLDESELEPIRRRVGQDSEIQAAYLVRKALKARLEDPLPLVLALQPRRPWYSLESSRANRQLQDRVAARITLPYAGVVIALGASQSGLRRKIRRVPGAEIYRWR